MTADAVIVGAGIVGAACAAELAARGMQVEVLDSHGIGGGATAAGMGHIVVMNDSPAEFALSAYSRELARAGSPAAQARRVLALRHAVGRRRRRRVARRARDARYVFGARYWRAVAR
jgi:glycine/D-amino acid oxidase-like deaminating enzyme